MIKTLQQRGVGSFVEELGGVSILEDIIRCIWPRLEEDINEAMREHEPSIHRGETTAHIPTADPNFFSNDLAMQMHGTSYTPALDANGTLHASTSEQTISCTQRSPHYTMQMYGMQHVATQNPNIVSNDQARQSPCFLPEIRIGGTFITSTRAQVNPSGY